MTENTLKYIQDTDNLMFPIKWGETLLATLEREKIAVHYQCRGGYCGACRTKILDGEVAYIKQPLAYVSKDEILPCCCVAKSQVVQLAVSKNNLQDECEADLFCTDFQAS